MRSLYSLKLEPEFQRDWSRLCGKLEAYVERTGVSRTEGEPSRTILAASELYTTLLYSRANLTTVYGHCLQHHNANDAWGLNVFFRNGPSLVATMQSLRAFNGTVSHSICLARTLHATITEDYQPELVREGLSKYDLTFFDVILKCLVDINDHGWDYAPFMQQYADEARYNNDSIMSPDDLLETSIASMENSRWVGETCKEIMVHLHHVRKGVPAVLRFVDPAGGSLVGELQLLSQMAVRDCVGAEQGWWEWVMEAQLRRLLCLYYFGGVAWCLLLFLVFLGRQWPQLRVLLMSWWRM